jgi:hypothetical protein
MQRISLSRAVAEAVCGLACMFFVGLSADRYPAVAGEVTCGVHVENMWEGDALISPEPRTVFGRNSGAACPATTGDQRALIILVNFLDQATEPYTSEEIREIVMDSSNPASVNSYIQEVSYGKAWLSGDVIDWLTLPINAVDCGSFFDQYTFGNLLDLLDPPVDATSYGRFLIVHPLKSDGPSCTPGSTSTLGPGPIDTSQGLLCASLLRVALDEESVLETTHARSLIHELGHSLGVGHAQDIECGGRSLGSVPGACTLSNPGRDRYDIMGQVGLRGHFNAVFKEQLEWIDPSQIESSNTVPAAALLDPIELPTSGTHLLKIPAVYDMGTSGVSRNYFITYRQAIGTDSGYPELQSPTTGVMIRLDVFLEDGPLQSALVDTSPHVTSGSLSQIDDSADVVLSVGEALLDVEYGRAITFADVVDGSALVTVDSYVASSLTATCKESKARAAGKKAAALLKAFGANVKRPDHDRLVITASKAQSRFAKEYSRAEHRGGCASISDSDAMGAKVDAFVNDVVAAIVGSASSAFLDVTPAALD